ncbi:MAG: hypothetical protein Q8N23_13155 [Archangium sp.]|nr:hypothetical protein [Archangium sp.]MDP3153619.1 hypothetical protein [Archangium sp.]MDP3569313.1 hypothetical protein [Archangium sp.]
MRGLLVVVLPLSVAFAAAPALKPPGKPGAEYLVLFNPAHVASVEGTIVRIYQVPSAKVWLTSVHAMVRTKQGDVSVNLGPSWFLDNQELHLAMDDRVAVTGSRVKHNGVESLIAIEVRRGDASLKLRAPDGMPVWVAWRTQASAPAATR